MIREAVFTLIGIIGTQLAKKGEQIELTSSELTKLKERLRKKQLDDRDVDTLVSVLELVTTLRTLLEKRRLGLMFWLRRVFGLKTEKPSQKDRNRQASADEQEKGKGRRGRNGRDDYPGAEKIEVNHPDLKPGDDCPECDRGKLREAEPGVDYDWQGGSPLVLKVYLLQRLLCHICKTSFTAPSPVAETAKTVDDSEDAEKVTRSTRNASANAGVACLRYLYGIPHYRLAKIQGQLGMGLPEATQYAMVSQVYDAALPVWEALFHQAAQGALLHADDTTIKILDWLRGKGPPSKTTGDPRKTAQTSAIVSRSAEGRDIVLYLTDEKAAGNHVANLLELRRTDRGVPIYMCDALAANKPGGEAALIQVYCLDHGRRQFVDIQSSYPKQAEYVIGQLKLVYKADKEAKKLGLSDEERLAHHKKHSEPAMTELGRWMQKQKQEELVEENSPLGKAIDYFLKRWTEMTEFLHTPGVPLSNSECERTIKLIITHRKNSLFYSVPRIWRKLQNAILTMGVGLPGAVYRNRLQTA